jgi:hypothetical protein
MAFEKVDSEWNVVSSSRHLTLANIELPKDGRLISPAAVRSAKDTALVVIVVKFCALDGEMAFVPEIQLACSEHP